MDIGDPRFFIKYKLFGETDYNEFQFKSDYESLKDMIFQLGKGFAKLNDKLVRGFQVIEDIEVLEQNYDHVSKGKHYISYTPDIEMIKELGEEYAYQISGACLEDQMEEIPYQKDITNSLLKECGISIQNLQENKGIRLSDRYLYVNGIDFKIEKETKTYEILDILLRIRSFESSDILSYESIMNYFMKNIYNELKQGDLNKEGIRNIIKSKMEEVRNYLGLSELPISAQKSGIVFRI